MINPELIRKQFSILNRKVNDRPLIYFDSAATNLRPDSVIEGITSYYTNYNANIHRGIHCLSEEATYLYEQTRELLQDFIGAKKREEIIFTRGTTESINLLARTYGETNLSQDDEVLISTLEHHSNIVPWQMVNEKKGSILKIIPIDQNGEIIFDDFISLLNEKVKIVSITHASNAIGTITPIKEMVSQIRKKTNAIIHIDAAQMVSHSKLNVQDLDCDFMSFSAHKMFGPTGIGCLYGKEKYLNEMPPFHGGGDMIDQVTFEKTTYNTIPHKFEAGTPSIASGIGWAKAINFINEIGLNHIASYEKELLDYTTKKLLEIEDLKIYGISKHKNAVLSFEIKGLHPQDIATFLDKDGIAIRTGHHCAQPLLKFLNVSSLSRASLSIYNTKEEIDYFIDSLVKIKGILG